jgi:general secretion pathway protein D
VQEFIYPTEFSTPQAGSLGSSGTASIPSAFRTREVGVILNVTPTVGPDGYTINLTLVPEVSEFRGFIDYSPDPTTSSAGGTNSSVSYKIIQPLFETRNVQTSVVIWDGQTVVLGGLMREDVSKLDDKVPFLGDIPVIGRLFRSKVTSRSKRNLLIFVTANLVDPAGNKIHRQDVSAVAAPLK